MTATDQLAVDTLRTLSIDAVQKANSGHPGAPMGLAPVAYSLWQEALRYDPAAPQWPGRDRFVLSGGHASALLYSLLHLAGVIETDAAGRPTGKPAIAMEDLQSFRQLHSKTPGHPEYGHTTGVETTTGPLGQGIANSVGMAIASRFFAARYSAHLGYRVWAMCGDGCDGGRGVRGGFDRGALALGELVLGVRLEPHHDRGAHGFGVQRRCGGAL